jgi:hypothetical protein
LLIPAALKGSSHITKWTARKQAYPYLSAPAEESYAGRRAAYAPRGASHIAASGVWCRSVGINMVRKNAKGIGGVASISAGGVRCIIALLSFRPSKT